MVIAVSRVETCWLCDLVLLICPIYCTRLCHCDNCGGHLVCDRRAVLADVGHLVNSSWAGLGAACFPVTDCSHVQRPLFSEAVWNIVGMLTL